MGKLSAGKLKEQHGEAVMLARDLEGKVTKAYRAALLDNSGAKMVEIRLATGRELPSHHLDLKVRIMRYIAEDLISGCDKIFFAIKKIGPTTAPAFAIDSCRGFVVGPTPAPSEILYANYDQLPF
jgi:hypothetical protein